MENGLWSHNLELSTAHTLRTPCICYIANNVDDHYQASCVHEQKANSLQWAKSLGVIKMADKKMLFVTLMDCAERFKVPLSQFFADFD